MYINHIAWKHFYGNIAMETLGLQKRQYITALPRKLHALVKTHKYFCFWGPNKFIATSGQCNCISP